MGSLGKVGTRFLLNIKLIEVETGETVSTASERYEKLDDLIDDTERLAKGFVTKDVTQPLAAAPAKTEAPTRPEPVTPEPVAVAQPEAAPQIVEAAAPTAEESPGTDEQAGPPVESAAGEAAPEGGDALAGPPAVAVPAQRRGAAIEVHGGFLVAFGQPYVEISGAFVYQFSSKFSLGAWGGVVPNAPMPTVGLRLVFGNKVDGLAFVLDLGVLPGLGLYYRSFLLVLEFVPTSPPILGFRAGYSIFLGRR